MALTENFESELLFWLHGNRNYHNHLVIENYRARMIYLGTKSNFNYSPESAGVPILSAITLYKFFAWLSALNLSLV